MRGTCQCFIFTLATLLGSALHLHAQTSDDGPAFLEVCNRGTVKVGVVMGFEDWDPLDYTMTVTHWVMIEPGKCDRPYEHDSASSWPETAYMGFAVFEAGRVVPVRATTVPDVGGWTYSSTPALLRYPAGKGRALTVADRQLCVNSAAVKYVVHTKGRIDCSSLNGPGSSGPLQPFVAQFFFHPSATHCYRSSAAVPFECYGGQYYLDVAPRAGDPNLRATPGDPDVPVSKPQTSPSATPPGEGTIEDLVSVVTEAVKGNGAPRPLLESRPSSFYSSLGLQVCVSTETLKKESWANPNSARARTLRTALRQYISSHHFRGAGSSREDRGGQVYRYVKVTESPGFVIEEINDCLGLGGFYVNVEVP
jgi:hypothetical protein